MKPYQPIISNVCNALIVINSLYVVQHAIYLADNFAHHAIIQLLAILAYQVIIQNQMVHVKDMLAMPLDVIFAIPIVHALSVLIHMP